MSLLAVVHLPEAAKAPGTGRDNALKVSLVCLAFHWGLVLGMVANGRIDFGLPNQVLRPWWIHGSFGAGFFCHVCSRYSRLFVGVGGKGAKKK